MCLSHSCFLAKAARSARSTLYLLQFFWSWFVLSFVLSFNVLRTRFYWPWLPLPFWTNYFSRRCVNDVAVAVTVTVAVDVAADNVCDQHCLGTMARRLDVSASLTFNRVYRSS